MTDRKWPESGEVIKIKSNEQQDDDHWCQVCAPQRHTALFMKFKKANPIKDTERVRKGSIFQKNFLSDN